MTRQESASTAPQTYAERSYRSPMGLVGGAMLIALGLWLGGDALVRGAAETKLTALFALVLGVPLVAAFTLRPVVKAGEDRLLVRNPFRTLTLPWGAVEDLRASFSCEVFTTGGRKYQLWAVPVSLRQRKKAGRQAARGAAPRRSVLGGDAGPVPRAMADQTMDELREIKAQATHREGASGEPVVRWAYGVIAPCVVGAIGLAIMAAV